MDSTGLSAKLKFYSGQNKIKLVAWKLKMSEQNWGMTNPITTMIALRIENTYEC